MPSPTKTELVAVKQTSSVPKRFTLLVRLAPQAVIETLTQSKGVQAVSRMPAATAMRKAFLLWTGADTFTLMKAPRRIETPSDEVADELQRLKVLGTVTDVGDGRSEVGLAFGWSISRTGYLSLWPFFVLLFASWWIYGLPAAAIVVVGFVVLHWPRGVQTRRRELVSKLSDALGPSIVESDRLPPYRS